MDDSKGADITRLLEEERKIMRELARHSIDLGWWLRKQTDTLRDLGIKSWLPMWSAEPYFYDVALGAPAVSVPPSEYLASHETDSEITVRVLSPWPLSWPQDPLAIMFSEECDFIFCPEGQQAGAQFVLSEAWGELKKRGWYGTSESSQAELAVRGALERVLVDRYGLPRGIGIKLAAYLRYQGILRRDLKLSF